MPPCRARFASLAFVLSLYAAPVFLWTMEPPEDQKPNKRSTPPIVAFLSKAPQKTSSETIFEALRHAPRPTRSPFEIALKNIEDNGHLGLAWTALQKCPRSLISLGYQRLIMDLNPKEFWTQGEPLIQEKTFRENLPPEVRSMLDASQLLRNYNAAKTLEGKDKGIRQIIEYKNKKQTSDSKTPYVCARLPAAVAHAQKTRGGIGPERLCVNWLQAFHCGALDVGPLMPEKFLRSKHFLGTETVENCLQSLNLDLFSAMQREASRAFKDKKDEFQVYCDLANTFRGEPTVSSNLCFMALMFKPLESGEKIPKILNFESSSALLGWPNGLFNLGSNYGLGIEGFPTDANLAIEYYKRASEATPFEGNQNNQRHQRIKEQDQQAIKLAFFNLGAIYEQGFIVNPDFVQSEKYMRQAIERGEKTPEAFASLGRSLISQQKWTEGVSLLKKAAKKDNARAHQELGKLFLKGNHEIPKDPKRALCHLEQFAQLESSLYSLACLDSCLKKNPDIDPQHYQNFIKEKLLALQLTDPQERWNRSLLLAQMTVQDLTQSPEKNTKKIQWLEDAYKIDPVFTSGFLASAWERVGDNEKALQYYEKSIEKMPPELLSWNIFVYNNYAALLMRRAISAQEKDIALIGKIVGLFNDVITESDDPELTGLAKLNMACLFLHNMCGPPHMDEKKTLRYLEECQDVDAYYELGRIYFLGLLGVEKDVHKAKEMMERSIGPGYGKGAKFNLAALLWSEKSAEGSERALQLFEESYEESPDDPMCALSLASVYVESKNLSEDKAAKIQELLELGRPGDPSYATYLNGICLLRGIGVQQDISQGSDLIFQAYVNPASSSRVIGVSYLPIVKDLVTISQETNKPQEKQACWNTAYSILCDQTGSSENPKQLNGSKAQAYLFRSFFEPDDEKVEWITLAIQKNVAGAQEVFDSFHQRTRFKKPSNKLQENDIDAKDPQSSEHIEDDEKHKVINVLSQSGLKWEEGLKAFTRYIKNHGGAMTQGAGSRIHFILGDSKFAIHSMHGREGGNPQMDPGRAKSMKKFIAKSAN
jgi:TPR repeat protein